MGCSARFLFSFTTILFFFLLNVVSHPGYSQQSWAEVSKTKKGSVTVYWYESRPFIYTAPSRQMAGIELEVMQGFVRYLKEKHNIDLTINWTKAESFSGLYEKIRDTKENCIGTSAFSVTDSRKQEVKFSPTYMSDITVLITSDDLPIVGSTQEFNDMLPKLTAIAIKKTTYEDELMKMKNEGNVPFNIKYIHSSENILRTIERSDSTFGFIDLPVYMLLFNEDPSLRVRRQNIYTVKRQGYAITFPMHSDWDEPVNEYFADAAFHANLERIIAKYIDIDLYHFVEGLAIQSNDQAVQLLTKEKEIQSKDLLNKSQQIVLETRKRNFLVALTGIVILSLVIIIVMYRKRNEQKQKIESQQKNIESKSDQLQKRNQHLLALDEEKNNLIKILAHDLRTPINHVQGLAQIFLLSNKDMADDQKVIITQIMDASVRLNKMITHLLDIDALENNRVTVFKDIVDLRKLLHEVVASFEKQAHKKEITISFSSECDSCRIEADSLFLIQVFENLVSNAIKFSLPERKIEVLLNEHGNKVRACVKDQGPGLTGEDLDNLFKKFHRLSAKPTSGEGSLGLGLSIVKKYVELMGGTVWCESTAGNGASFFVEFDKA